MHSLFNNILSTKLEKVLFFLTVSFLIVTIFNPEISFAAADTLEGQLEKTTEFIVGKPLALFTVFIIVFAGGALLMNGQGMLFIKLLAGMFGLGIAAMLAKNGAFLKLLA